MPQDYAQATEWYLKAVEQSHPTAQYNMGSMYEEGEGVPQDYSRAMDWYLKAAEQGHLDGLYNIGSMYEEREGVPQDFIRFVALNKSRWHHRMKETPLITIVWSSLVGDCGRTTTW